MNYSTKDDMVPKLDWLQCRKISGCATNVNPFMWFITSFIHTSKSTHYCSHCATLASW